MLYQNLVTRKVLRVLEFRGVSTVDRAHLLTPLLAEQYLVPMYLRRDVYWQVMTTRFPKVPLDVLERLLNNAYPQKVISPQEATKVSTHTVAQAEQVN